MKSVISQNQIFLYKKNVIDFVKWQIPFLINTAKKSWLFLHYKIDFEMS